jgi:ribosomal protein S18 acetylase RimI-like enzyme
MKIRSFRSADVPAVIALWDACGLVVPWNDPSCDIQRKMKVQPEMFLVGGVGDSIVASVMAGFDGHRGWINYLAVHPDFRRSGYGRQLMDEAETLLRKAGCPKINLQVRSTNHDVIAFYQRIGFKQDDVVSYGKRLVDDE